MARSVLRDVAWIPVYGGGNVVEEHITVEDALTRGTAVNSEPALDTRSILGGLAYEAGSTLRFLASIVAIAERFRSSEVPRPDIDPHAVNQALDLLEPYCDLYSSDRPFLQRKESQKAPLESFNPDTTRVKNLSPAIPSLRNLIFWGLRSYPSALTPEQSVLALLGQHYYSAAGNSPYDGDKTQMGAPGLRFPGKDYTATEVIACADRLYTTLLMNIPQSWAEGSSLPAWADRVRENSEESHPLWQQTWSSNTAVVNWDDDGKMIRAKDCGIPPAWYSPAQGKDKKSWKSWWDTRNESDPFYLYRADDKGNKSVKRLDIGRDATDLAVSWIAEGNAHALREHLIVPLRLHNEEPEDIVFLRHQVGGTGSSPCMRASEIFIADPATWAPNEDILDELQLITDGFLKFRRELLKRFRGAYSGESSTEATTFLPELESLRGDAHATFWREVTPAFTRLITNNPDEVPTDELIDRVITEVYEATLRSYDLVTHAYEHQYMAQISTVRRILRIACRRTMKDILAGEEDE